MRLELWEDGQLVGQHDERGDVDRAVKIAARELRKRWPKLKQSAWIAVVDDDELVVVELTMRRL